MIVRKLGAQEARERASADQLSNTDEKTKDYEKLVLLYKYVAIELLPVIHGKYVVLLYKYVAIELLPVILCKYVVLLYKYVVIEFLLYFTTMMYL